MVREVEMVYSTLYCRQCLIVIKIVNDIHHGPRKGAILSLTITLIFLDGFLQLLHHWKQE